jgi:hypothetical protein
MRKLTNEEMQETVEYLQGTCLSINDALNQVLGDKGIEEMSDVDNEIEFCDYIDQRIFLCSQCGWWYETGEWVTDQDPNWDPDEETCIYCGDENNE